MKFLNQIDPDIMNLWIGNQAEIWSFLIKTIQALLIYEWETLVEIASYKKGQKVLDTLRWSMKSKTKRKTKLYIIYNI